MLLRIMIAVGLLGLAGCVTTPDYRYTTVADGYGNSSNGYYTDDGYYGDSNASVGYYDGYDNGGGYLTSTWGASPWFGYGSGWGMGYANYGPYGFTPGWGSYYGSGWGLGFGSYWGSYAYSPFFPFYGFPYWYNNYPQQEHHHRRDLSAVRAEQLRQADYQRSESRYRPDNSAGIRMWTPNRRVVTSTRTTPRDNTRDAALQQAMLHRAPVRDHTVPTIDRRETNMRPAIPVQRRYQTMPRGTPGLRDTPTRRTQPISRSTQPRLQVTPRPRAIPSRPARATPRATPRSMPQRSMPRSMPKAQPAARAHRTSDLP